MSRGVDLRGFVDALAPALRRCEWQLDRQRAAWSQARQALAAAQAAVDALDAVRSARAAEGATELQLAPDPWRHAATLRALAALNARHAQLVRERDRCAHECAIQRDECGLAQARLDGLVRHRADALARFARTQAARHQTAVDRDWLVRAQHRAARQEPA